MTHPDLPLPSDLAAELQELRRAKLVLTQTGLRLRQKRKIVPPSFTCERILAETSPDFLHPWGTRRDNSSNLAFNLKLAAWLGWDKLTVLDLGCSGGGFVQSLLDAGCLACGIEGSDLSRKMKRAAWASIPQFLHVGDITRSYSFEGEDGAPIRFSVVTAWEVLEHLPTPDLPVFFYNVKNNLQPGGLFMASISTQSDKVNGVELHQTIKSEAWWLETLQREGLTPHPGWVQYFGEDMVRGPNNAAHSFNIICSVGEQVPAPPPADHPNSVLPIQERISPRRRMPDNGAPLYKNVDEAMLIAPFELRLAKAPEADVVAAIRLAMDFGISTTGFEILLTECNSTLAKHADTRVHSSNAIARLKPVQGVIARLHYLQGLAEGFEGDYAAALGHLATARSMGSNAFWTAYHLCNFHALSGRLTAAVVEGRRALTLREDYPKLADLVRRLELQRDQLRFRRLQSALGSSRLRFAAILTRRTLPRARHVFGSFVAAVQAESLIAGFLEAAARKPSLVVSLVDGLGILHEASLLFVYPGARLEFSGVPTERREFFQRLASLPSPEEEVVQTLALGGIVILADHASPKEVAKLWQDRANHSSRTLLWKTTPKIRLEDLQQTFALRPNERVFLYPSRASDRDDCLVVAAPAAWLPRLATVPVIRVPAMAESIALAWVRCFAEHHWEELQTFAQLVAQKFPLHQVGRQLLIELLDNDSRGSIENLIIEASLKPLSAKIRAELHQQLLEQAKTGEVSRLDAYLPYDRNWAEGWRVLARHSAAQPDREARFIKALAELERLCPHEPETVALRAEDAERTKAWGEAEACWTSLVRRYPDSRQYLDRMVAARGQDLAGLRKHFGDTLQSQNWVAARELNELILAKDQNWSDGYFHRAQLLARASAALPLIERAYAEAIDHGYDVNEARMARAEERFARGQTEAAGQDLVTVKSTGALTPAVQVRWTKLEGRLVQALDAACAHHASQRAWTKLGECLHSMEQVARDSEPFRYWQSRVAFETAAEPKCCDGNPEATPSVRIQALQVRILVRQGRLDEAHELWASIEGKDQSDWLKETQAVLTAAVFSRLAERALTEISNNDYEAAFASTREALRLRPDWVLGALIRRWAQFLLEGDLRLLGDLPIGYTAVFAQLPPAVQSAFSSWRALLGDDLKGENFAAALKSLVQPGQPVLETWLRLVGQWTYRSALLQQLASADESLRLELALHCRSIDRRLDSPEARWLAVFWERLGRESRDVHEPFIDWPVSPTALSVVLAEAYARPDEIPLAQAWNRLLASIPEQYSRVRPADRETAHWLRRLGAIKGSATWIKGASQLRLLGWPLPQVVLLLITYAKGAAGLSAAARADLIATGLEILPESPELLAASAEAEFTCARQEAAMARVREFRRLTPDHALLKGLEDLIFTPVVRPMLAAAKASKYQGAYPEAQRNYEECLGIWPGCAEAHFELARILDDLRSSASETVIAYTRALENGWNAYDVYYHRGLFFFEINHSFEAFSDLVAARRLRPDCTISQAMVTHIGNREKQHWMEAVEQWVNQGQLQHAIWVLSVLVDTEFTSGAAHYFYACALSWSGKNDASTLTQFDLALANGAQEFWVRYNRAFVHFAMGNNAAAVADMQEATRLDPTHEGASSTLKSWISP